MTTELKQSTRSGGAPESTCLDAYYRPIVDIVETRDELLILADMPGVSAEQIDINFEDGALTIHGRVVPRQEGQTNFLLREYGLGDFYRVFQVSEHLDASRISAQYEHGVLTLHLPKSERAKPRKVEVQAT